MRFPQPTRQPHECLRLVYKHHLYCSPGQSPRSSVGTSTVHFESQTHSTSLVWSGWLLFSPSKPGVAGSSPAGGGVAYFFATVGFVVVTTVSGTSSRRGALFILYDVLLDQIKKRRRQRPPRGHAGGPYFCPHCVNFNRALNVVSIAHRYSYCNLLCAWVPLLILEHRY